MKKLIIILTLGLLWPNTSLADSATCMAGECEFLIGIWYEYAETLCMQPLVMEEVDQGPFGFTIVETGEYCAVFNER